MNSIIYIFVTHLCRYKKIFSWVSYILQRAVTGMEKQVRVEYRVQAKRPLKTLTSLTKQFIDTNV